MIYRAIQQNGSPLLLLTAGIREFFSLPDNLLAWAIEPVQEDSVIILPGEVQDRTVIIAGKRGQLTGNQSVNIVFPAWYFHRGMFSGSKAEV
jgi:hypothetical protein